MPAPAPPELELPNSWGDWQLPDAALLSMLWGRSNCAYHRLRVTQKGKQIRLLQRLRHISDDIPESPCDSRFTSFSSEAETSPGGCKAPSLAPCLSPARVA